MNTKLNTLAALMAAVAALPAASQTVTIGSIVMPETCDLYRGDLIAKRGVPDNPPAIAASIRVDQATYRASANYWCRSTTNRIPVTYTPAPAPAPTPAPAPAPVPAGASVLYFSDCQADAAAGCVPGSNANPGTQASPKRDLAGINLGTLGAGSQLLFKRGGSWNIGQVELANNNVSAANPLVIDAWGAGDRPVLRSTSVAAALQFGGRWGNTDNDGGYVVRNVKIDGQGVGQTGIWLLHNVHDVTIENVEITGFWIGIYGTPGVPYGVNNVTFRNSTVRRNGSMGWLGGADNLTIDNVLFEANNFNGDPRNHALYLSHSDNVRITNNRFLRNSVVQGRGCTGGNVTVHGIVNGMTIENNLIEQDASAETCYGFAITSGYDTAEAFRDTVLRGNTVVNLGLCSYCINSAPGIVVERNRAINTRPTYHIAINEPANGEQDIASSNAVVRDNVFCSAGGGAGAGVQWSSPGATLLGNVTRVGADATTGPCSR